MNILHFDVSSFHVQCFFSLSVDIGSTDRVDFVGNVDVFSPNSSTIVVTEFVKEYASFLMKTMDLIHWTVVPTS